MTQRRSQRSSVSSAIRRNRAKSRRGSSCCSIATDTSSPRHRDRTPACSGSSTPRGALPSSSAPPSSSPASSSGQGRAAPGSGRHSSLPRRRGRARSVPMRCACARTWSGLRPMRSMRDSATGCGRRSTATTGHCAPDQRSIAPERRSGGLIIDAAGTNREAFLTGSPAESAVMTSET